MSLHPSLSSGGKGKKVRSVLKRTERLKTMLDKNLWKEGDRVFGLPKMKTVRIKIKKEKVEKAATETAAAPAGQAPAAGSTAPAKGGAKAAEKK